MPLKSMLSKMESRFLLWRGVRRLRGELAAGHVSEVAIHEMWLGWGNYGYSASPALVYSACVESFRHPAGMVVELGSGLSTIALAIVAEHTKGRVCSIDHDQTWCQELQRHLQRLRVSTASISHSALKPYGNFEWYSMESIPDPERIDLLVVDGPPASTLGGRGGALELLAPKLSPKCCIFIDDVVRPAEAELASQWATNFGLASDTFYPTAERAFSVLKPKGHSIRA